VNDEHVPLREHFEELRKADEAAVNVALKAADEKSKSHNDILSELRHQQSTYVTKEQVRWAFTAMLAGGALVVAIFAAISGAGV